MMLLLIKIIMNSNDLNDSAMSLLGYDWFVLELFKTEQSNNDFLSNQRPSTSELVAYYRVWN